MFSAARSRVRGARGLRAIACVVDAEEHVLISTTQLEVAAAGEGFTKHFYARMFAAHPELKNVFNLQNQKTGRQQKALFSAVAASAVSVLETGELPRDMLEGIHQKHCALNVQPGQYSVVGEHILGTIREVLTPAPEVLDAWGALYGAIAAHAIEREEVIYKEAEAKTGGWRGERDFVVARRKMQSSDVMEFDFTPKDGKPVSSFIPGQYTTLWVQGEGCEFRQPRHYTLLPWSFPYVTPGLSIAVKNLEGGMVSKHLHENVREGDVVQLSPPFGNFHINHAAQLWVADTLAPVVLLSAGVGITPTLSMLASLKNQRPVLWLHAAQNGRQHPFRSYLRGLGSANSPLANEAVSFTRRVWYEDAAWDDVRYKGDDLKEANAAMYHYDGRMDLAKVSPLLPLRDKRAMFFICGPSPWMRDVAKQLAGLGVQKDNIQFEIFGPGTGEAILPE